MQQLTWSPKLSFCIENMDEAHQVLIRKLIDIMTAPDHEFKARFLTIVAVSYTHLTLPTIYSV